MDGNSAVKRSQYLYVKAEAKQSAWVPIKNDPQALDYAIRRGNVFATTTVFTGSAHKGPDDQTLRNGHWYFDFDHKDDPEIAFKEGRRLVAHLEEMYDLAPHDLYYWHSGGKGCHICIPDNLIGSNAGHPKLPEAYKLMAGRLADSLQLEKLDMQLYCMGKGRMLRIPNTRRPDGKFKVPLTHHEFFFADYGELEAFTEAPRTIGGE